MCEADGTLASGMQERHLSSSFVTMLIANVALKDGSSQQGNIMRADAHSNWVTAKYGCFPFTGTP